MIHVNVGSPAGAYSVGSTAFFRYVVRLSDIGLNMHPADRDATDVLGAIPNAYVDEDEYSGNGWRVVPASSYEDWPVLEATPERLRMALETARRVLWENAASAGVTAREISSIDDEIEKRALGRRPRRSRRFQRQRQLRQLSPLWSFGNAA